MSFLFSKNTFMSTVKGRLISAGQNIIPKQELDELLKDSFVAGQVSLGKYVIEEGAEISFVNDEGEDTSSKLSDAEKAAYEISTLSVKEAIIKIAGNPKVNEDIGILDITVLKKIAEVDKRKGIQTAVEEQIEMLHSRDEEEK